LSREIGFITPTFVPFESNPRYQAKYKGSATETGPFFLFNNNLQTIYSLLGGRDVLEVEVK